MVLAVYSMFWHTTCTHGYSRLQVFIQNNSNIHSIPVKVQVQRSKKAKRKGSLVRRVFKPLLNFIHV